MDAGTGDEPTPAARGSTRAGEAGGTRGGNLVVGPDEEKGPFGACSRAGRANGSPRASTFGAAGDDFFAFSSPPGSSGAASFGGRSASFSTVGALPFDSPGGSPGSPYASSSDSQSEPRRYGGS